NEELHVWADGHFSLTDCFQWPQLYVREWEFSVCIPHRENHPFLEALSWVWYYYTNLESTVSNQKIQCGAPGSNSTSR
ncbi:hypothetical protein EV363DRAFT_1160266, partial [Boletus edulis]